MNTGFVGVWSCIKALIRTPVTANQDFFLFALFYWFQNSFPRVVGGNGYDDSPIAHDNFLPVTGDTMFYRLNDRDVIVHLPRRGSERLRLHASLCDEYPVFNFLPRAIWPAETYRNLSFWHGKQANSRPLPLLKSGCLSVVQISKSLVVKIWKWFRIYAG